MYTLTQLISENIRISGLLIHSLRMQNIFKLKVWQIKKFLMLGNFSCFIWEFVTWELLCLSCYITIITPNGMWVYILIFLYLWRVLFFSLVSIAAIISESHIVLMPKSNLILIIGPLSGLYGPLFTWIINQLMLLISANNYKEYITFNRLKENLYKSKDTPLVSTWLN